MQRWSRREFVSASGTGLAGAAIIGPPALWPDERAMARAESRTDSFKLLRREGRARGPDLPEPADFHRLPLSWYKAKIRELKSEARKRGVDSGLFLTRRWNIIYATGLFHSTTERPFACFLPMDDDDALIWLNPYLDQQLVNDWWTTRSSYYFDYHHARGGFPSRGEVVQGDTVNLYRWWGEIETPERKRPESGAFGQMAAVMPDAGFVDINDIMIRSRIVKDEMENRLTQRAMDFWSEIHAFARDYLLERGTEAVDWEVANAARLWGTARIMDEIPQTGVPHDAVGISVGVGCRTGRTTAYPHPNQMFWKKVEPGDALQISGVVRVGGYGGELYRSFLISPWTEWQERVWDVHTRCYEIQAEESYASNTCSNVAKAVHDYQVENGVEHLIYHRPGHGEGMEGHQPPYQALGDYTVMREGMHFSNEPGLYDPENGFGFNHSNNILVSSDAGLQMGTTPATREWCFLDL